MSEISKNPSDDLPNEEKNQYQTVWGFIYKREIKKRIKKISDLSEEGETETAGKVKWGNENTAACLE